MGKASTKETAKAEANRAGHPAYDAGIERRDGEAATSTWPGWRVNGRGRGKSKPGELANPGIIYSTTIAATAFTTNTNLQESSPELRPAPENKPLRQLITSGRPTPNIPPPPTSNPLPPPPPTRKPPRTHSSIYTQLAEHYTKNLLPATDFLSVLDPDTKSRYQLCNFTPNHTPCAVFDHKYLIFIKRLQARGILCHKQFPIPTAPYPEPLSESIPNELRMPLGYWASQSVSGGSKRRYLAFVSGQIKVRNWWSWILSVYVKQGPEDEEKLCIFELPAGGKLKMWSSLEDAGERIAEGRPGVLGWEEEIQASWDLEREWALMRKQALEIEEERRTEKGKERGECMERRERERQLELKLRKMRMKLQVVSTRQRTLKAFDDVQPKPLPKAFKKGASDEFFGCSWDTAVEEARVLFEFRNSIRQKQLPEKAEATSKRRRAKEDRKALSSSALRNPTSNDASGFGGGYWMEGTLGEEDWLIWMV